MRSTLVLALVGALAAGAMAQTVEKMGIWVPLYSEPDGEYEKMIKSVENDTCLTDSFHGTVLTGPRSGPPNVTDEFEDGLYRERFSVVSTTQQWTAFGYVSTLYSARPIEEVLADINTWLTPGAAGYGDLVQGIWVDATVSNFSAATREYYGRIAQEIKSFGKLVAFNPGTRVNDCNFMRTAGADFVNSFEDRYSVWQQQPKNRTFDCPCKDIVRCIASIHQYPADATEADLAETMTQMAARGFKAMFITERIMPFHYLNLPTFWPNVITAACATDAVASSASFTAQAAAPTTPASPAPVASPEPSPAPTAP